VYNAEMLTMELPPVNKGERRIIVCVEHGNNRDRVATSARHSELQQQVR